MKHGLEKYELKRWWVFGDYAKITFDQQEKGEEVTVVWDPTTEYMGCGLSIEEFIQIVEQLSEIKDMITTAPASDCPVCRAGAERSCEEGRDE